MNKFFCRLTGGHKYSTVTLVSYYCPLDDTFYFGNSCEKCGEFNKWDVPAVCIEDELNRAAEKRKRRADNG